MNQHRKRIVLYYPRQTDERSGTSAGMDLLPVALLSIAAWPVREGYEVVIIDGNLSSADEAHRRVTEACEGALLYGTTGTLGHQVSDGLECTRRVKARHPELPAFIGGWFASVMPELQLATGLYDAVCLGQGEVTFRELVQAVDAGTSLEDVAGLVLSRDGRFVRTRPRAVVGWEELLTCPWGILDIEPYRTAQLAGRGPGEVERLPAPPGFAGKPFFGISYFSSFGCPEPCAFCSAPGVSSRRWKAMSAERMLDDLCQLHERWGLDALRFFDANFGVSQKRVKALAEGLIERGHHFWWYALMQTDHVAKYEPATLDAMRDSGMYCVQLGTETGDAGVMSAIGKQCAPEVNERAVRRLAQRGICSLATYVIGFPDESEQAMMRTVEQCERIASVTPLCRAMVWPFRPIPGTGMYPRSLELGFEPPPTLAGWGEADSYHLTDQSPWPGQLPPRVAERRKVYEHFAGLAVGVGKRRIGFWGRRAQRRVREQDYRHARLEARVYTVLDAVARRVLPTAPDRRIARLSGYQTSVLAARDRPGAGSAPA
ncbi:MAG: radical SAM protein [Planctomycetota bacterium]|jgi:radical SAM superfamily enzyme YgiQ (UPF0313 family)|nr:radical SAM protein [Planctomycetota bacterium]MDP6989199.1 radical SAM protein [Planctomycetota bacterium]